MLPQFATPYADDIKPSANHGYLALAEQPTHGYLEVVD
jgi:hypothetical protein